MAIFNTIKFSQLEKLSKIEPDDKLIVDTFIGTFTIPVSLLVLKDGNVSFTNFFNSISALVSQEKNTASTQLSALSAALNTSLNFVTAGFYSTLSSEYVPVLYRSGIITIPANSLDNTATVTVSAGMVLSAFDVNLHLIQTSQPFLSGAPVFVYPFLKYDGSDTYTLSAKLGYICKDATTVGYTICKPIR